MPGRMIAESVNAFIAGEIEMARMERWYPPLGRYFCEEAEAAADLALARPLWTHRTK